MEMTMSNTSVWIHQARCLKHFLKMSIFCKIMNIFVLGMINCIRLLCLFKIRIFRDDKLMLYVVDHLSPVSLLLFAFAFQTNSDRQTDEKFV